MEVQSVSTFVRAHSPRDSFVDVSCSLWASGVPVSTRPLSCAAFPSGCRPLETCREVSSRRPHSTRLGKLYLHDPIRGPLFKHPNRSINMPVPFSGAAVPVRSPSRCAINSISFTPERSADPAGRRHEGSEHSIKLRITYSCLLLHMARSIYPSIHPSIHPYTVPYTISIHPSI